MQRLQRQGWQVELIYLALSSVEMSKLRVAERVAHGGHDIAPRVIERLFARILRNLLFDYSHAADACQCFLNITTEPVLIFEQEGEERNILHENFYQQLLHEAGQ